jgi:hypothetical protein
MAVQNPYQLTSAEQDEIRRMSSQFGMTPDQGLAEANIYLSSGVAASMEDLRRIASDTLARNQSPAPNYYQLTSAEQDELRKMAPQFGMTPEQALAEADIYLSSGVASNMEDLRKIAADTLVRNQGPLVGPSSDPNRTITPNLTGYQPISTAPAAQPITSQVTTAPSQGYTPATYTAEGYTPTTYEAQGYTPTERGFETYDAQQAEQTQWNVTPDQLVENRIQGLLTKGSPLLTLAETRARQGMAGRGLLSSSMAEGEALRAVTESARDIATSDAATLARAGEFNAQQANILSQFNVQQVNAAAAYTAEAANQALADNQRVINSAAEFMADATNVAAANNAISLNQAAQFAAEAANQANAAAALAENNARAFAAQARNTADLSAAQDANTAARQAASDANRARELAIQAENDARRFSADASNRAAENERLIAADAQLRELDRRSQVNAQATNLFQASTDSINRIMADPDLTPEAKQAAVDNAKRSLESSIRFLEQANNISGLSSLVTFPTTTTAPGATAPGTTTGGVSDSYIRNMVQNAVGQSGEMTIDAQRQIAQQMAAGNISPDQVARATGYTPEEVRAAFEAYR